MTEQEAYLKLAALCANAEHCQHEMLEKMRKWEVPEAVQARVMARLVKERYVDDERYARAFVKDKIRYNKWGRRKVQQGLWMKHIDDEIQQKVLDEVEKTRVSRQRTTTSAIRNSYASPLDAALPSTLSSNVWTLTT